MRALDGWPSPRPPRGDRATEPGVQPDSSACQVLDLCQLLGCRGRCPARGESGDNQPHRNMCDVRPDASSISSCAFVSIFIASSLSALAPATSSPTRGWFASEGWRLA